MGADLGSCLRAGAIAAVISGAPSTVWAVLARENPLAPTLAAGRLLCPREQRGSRLVAAAGIVHTVLSLGWAVALGRTTPAAAGPRRTLVHGALFGLGIAGADLGLARVSPGARFAGVKQLRLAPQVADHLAYGLTVAAVLVRRDARPAQISSMASAIESSTRPGR